MDKKDKIPKIVVARNMKRISTMIDKNGKVISRTVSNSASDLLHQRMEARAKRLGFK